MLLLKLLIRNAFRHKLRTYLTILGLAIAILAFGILRTVAGAWYTGVEASAANRLVTRNSISIIFSLPISYYEKIRQVSGVEAVSYGNWFGGIYIDERHFFANFAIDSKHYFEMFPEFVLSPEHKMDFMKDRKAAIVGQKLMERFGWKIGDNVTLKGTIFPGNWDFVIRGMYTGRDRTTDETQFFFHWDYLNENVKKTEPSRAGQTGFFIEKIEDPSNDALIAREIDAMFRNSIAETLTETEKSFQMGFVSMTEAILRAIQIVSIIVIIIIMAVMTNTMAMSVRERMAEYAVFKTLGFGGRHLAVLILGESVVIAALGCALGMALTYPAAGLFARELGQYFPVFIIKRSTIYLDIISAVVVALTAAVIPSYRVVSASITDALRKGA